MTRKSPGAKLRRFLNALKLRQVDLVTEANKVASWLGEESISIRHLKRLLSGESEATVSKIRLLVATARLLSGWYVRATDLFDLEPDAAHFGPAALLGHPDPFRGAVRRLSVFSIPRTVRPWTPSMAQDERQLSAAETLAILYDAYASLMRATAVVRYRIPGEEAEALVNDVFTSYLERQPHVEDIRAYLIGAIDYSCRHYLRKRVHETPLLDEHEDLGDNATAEGLDQWTLRLMLAASLARIGPKCREVIKRHYYGEEPHKAIAKVLDTTAGNVKKMLYGCRQRLRSIYSELGGTKR